MFKIGNVQERIRFLGWLAVIMLAVFGVGALWMASDGQIGAPDEALHWTQPWRFDVGDKPFLDEWHPSVLCGILLLPILKVFRLLGGGSVNSFMLVTRHVFAFVWVSLVLLSGYRWRRFGLTAVIIGISMVVVYPPWGECNFSYNSIGVISMMVAVALYSTNEKCKKRDYFISGLFFSVAVLCCPHLFLVYVCYSVWHLKRLDGAWAMFTAACVCAALVFGTYIFSHIPLSQFLDALPNVLNDPEHPKTSLICLLKNGIGRFVFITHDYAYGHAVIIVSWILVVIVSFFDVGRYKRLNYYSFFECALAIGLWLYYFVQPMVGHNPSYMVVPLLAGGVGVLVLKEDRLLRDVFFSAWLPVAGYAFVLLLSSNMGIYSASFAFEAASIPAAIILCRFMSTNHVAYGIKLLMALLICAHAWFSLSDILGRITRIMKEDRVELTAGPLAGARVSQVDAESYMTLWNDTNGMRCDDKVSTVCYLDHRNQWLYLGARKKCGSFSSWMCGVNTNSIARLEEFWRVRPEKIADVIFLPKVHSEFIDLFESKYGYYPEVKESGNIILWRKDLL